MQEQSLHSNCFNAQGISLSLSAPQSHPGAEFCTLQAVFGKRELNWSNCFKNSAKAAVMEFLSEFMAHALGWAKLLPGAALLLGETKQRGGYGEEESQNPSFK